MVAILSGLPALLAGQLYTYQWPLNEGEAVRSDRYRVFVTHGNGEEEEIQVLMSDAIYSGDYREDYLKGRTFSFAPFSYDAENGAGLTFRVEKVYGSGAGSVYIAPRSYGIEPTLSGDGMEVTFHLAEHTRYISIHFISADNAIPVTGDQSWIKHMLCIFVDPPEEDFPLPSDEGVVVYDSLRASADLEAAEIIYFPAGHHNLADYTDAGHFISDRGKITLRNNQWLYMEGGAFLEGNIETSGDNNRIYGRGILSMRQYFWKNSAGYDGYDAGYIIHLGKNSKVQGIMCMEAPWHGIVGGSGNVIENIKYLGWHCNNDGVRVGSKSVIRNGFMRCVDDDFYNFNIHVHDMVLWKGHNGSIMTYGWGGENTYNSGASLMEDIDIIHPEWTGLGNNNGLIMSQTAYDYAPHDYGTGSTTTILRNIRIEEKIPGLVNIKCKEGEDPLPRVPMSKVGYLGDLRLENISVDHQFDRGKIAGRTDVASDGYADYFCRNISMEEVRIGGTCVTGENRTQFFIIDTATTRDLHFQGCNETGISITFEEPADGDRIPVTDSLKVLVNVTDADGEVTGVSLFLDGVLVGEKSAPPFEWNGDSLLGGLQIGEHFLKVVATDNDGNSWEETIRVSITPRPNAENPKVLVRSDTSLLLSWEERIDDETGFIVERSPAYRDEYTVLDTVPANTVGYLDGSLAAFTLYQFRIRTLYENGVTQPTAPVLGRPMVSGHAGLPDGWENLVCGDTLVAMSSTASFHNDTFTIYAGDGDFWTGTDRGHIIYTPWTGDCDVRAQVVQYTHAQSYTMAGVTIRDSLDWASGFGAMFLISSPGAIVRFRHENGGPVNQEINNTGELAPYFVRLKRVGNELTGSVSPDGVIWKTVRHGIVEMSGVNYAGLAATTHTTGSEGTYSFTDVYVGPVAAEYTITATAGIGGIISPAGKHTVLGGATLGFSFTPNQGYQIADVLVDEVPAGITGSYTFEDIHSDHTIRVIFSRVVSLDEEDEAPSLRIYPNPVSDLFYIEPGNGMTGILSVYSALGEKVLEETILPGSTGISVAGLIPGIYMIKLDSRDGQRTGKIVIK